MPRQASVCSLCSVMVPAHPILDHDQVFCCHGCHAVFTILSTKNQLTDFHSHPLFQQAVRSGLISNPDLFNTLRNKNMNPHSPADECEKLHLEIRDMWCPSCAEVIRLILLQEEGVKSCIVDYATDLASIEFFPRDISKETIYTIIKSLGYYPLSLQSEERRTVTRSLYFRFIVAAFFSLNIMMLSYPIYASYFDGDDQGMSLIFSWLSLAASLPIVTYCSWPIFRRCRQSLMVGIAGMELLVTLGVISAFGLSCYELVLGSTRVYFDSMSVIITFVLLGKIIEAKAKFSAKDSLIRLSRALPRRGRKRFPGGEQVFVPLKEIQIGDVVVSLTGEKIVLDGIVVEGEGCCDEALMTGECWPVPKQVGSKVIGGTIVQQGWLAVRIVATPEESSLQRILQIIEQTVGQKTSYTRAIDPFIQWFVPLVLLTAFIVGLMSGLWRAVSVLLISCPCAIGIAAPLAEAHLINGLARLGAIVRNRGCLAWLGKETVFIFDKTGTVTHGHFKLLKGFEPLTPYHLATLKAMTIRSSHPIACAITRAVDLEAAPTVKAEERAGLGILGIDMRNGTTYYLGSALFLHQYGIPIPPSTYDIDTNNKGIVTEVYFACTESFLTVLTLGDTIREGMPKLVRELSQGLECGGTTVKTLLVSGDGQPAVESVAKTCQFNEWHWRYHPLQKQELVNTLKERGEIIAMLGDGINDAAALTASQIGISVVSASDISIQVSDILLTTDRVEVIGSLRKLGQKGRKIIMQNIFWAFFYNVIGIFLAIGGWLSPLFAAFAMIISSLIVLLNAQRLSR